LQFGVCPREPFREGRSGPVELQAFVSKTGSGEKKSEPFEPGFSMLCCEFQVINKVYNTNLPIVKASQPLNGAGFVQARPMCKEMVNAALH
jgi:hypothetical protein